MEGNSCYKYEEIKRFIEETRLGQVLSVVEVGANIGNITKEIAECFPDAIITSYEPVEKYAQKARECTANYPNIKIITGAVTSEHLYEDDLGLMPRRQRIDLHTYFATHGGPGWEGGSFVHKPNTPVAENFTELQEPLNCFTLDEIVAGVGFVDYLKTDCEGAENSFLGCAEKSTLEKIRFIAGEYHNFKRFWPVVKKLMNTHYVNLVGVEQHEAALGSFFCEKRTEGKTLLQKNPLSPSQTKLHPELIWWHSWS